jgi:hypothetical protein
MSRQRLVSQHSEIKCKGSTVMSTLRERMTNYVYKGKISLFLSLSPLSVSLSLSFSLSLSLSLYIYISYFFVRTSCNNNSSPYVLPSHVFAFHFAYRSSWSCFNSAAIYVFALDILQRHSHGTSSGLHTFQSLEVYASLKYQIFTSSSTKYITVNFLFQFHVVTFILSTEALTYLL